MHKKQRNILWLIIGISGISGMGWFTNTYTPDSIQRLWIFYVLFFASGFFLLLYLLNNIRRAILCAAGITIFLLLRSLNLREPWYLLLLVASLISLEVFFQKR